MKKSFFAFFVLMAASMLAGCTTTLEFQSGAPYQTTYRVNDAALVAIPDKMAKDTYKVSVGDLPWEKHVFEVPIGEAYSVESRAHMQNFFRGGVTVVTHDVLESLEKRTEETAESEAEEESELDRILDELAEKKADPDSTERTEEEIREEIFEEAGMEELLQKDANYLVRFHDTLYLMNDGRVVVSFRASLVDRRTGAQFFEKRYTGKSRRFDPARSNKTNQENLVNLTREAFNGSMKKLVYDMAVALDAYGL